LTLRLAISTTLLLILAGCGPDYSPDTYSSNAVQQANKVEQGVVVGVRDVAVTAAGTTGAVTGGAAGGIAGSQVGTGPVSAFAALGGTLVGGLTGAAVEHAAGDTNAYEYIVRKGNGDLVSVTQKDKVPLALGQKVLVIAGNQARVVPDYTVNLTPSEKEKAAEAAKGQDQPKPPGAPKTAGLSASTSSEGSDSSTPQPPAPAVQPAAGASTASQPQATSASAQPGNTQPPAGASASGPSDASKPVAAMPAAASSPASQPPAGASAPIRLTDPLPHPADAATPATAP
jgi:outer membrane lipoprotein SlyB